MRIYLPRGGAFLGELAEAFGVYGGGAGIGAVVVGVPCGRQQFGAREKIGRIAAAALSSGAGTYLVDGELVVDILRGAPHDYRARSRREQTAVGRGYENRRIGTRGEIGPCRRAGGLVLPPVSACALQCRRQGYAARSDQSGEVVLIGEHLLAGNPHTPGRRRVGAARHLDNRDLVVHAIDSAAHCHAPGLAYDRAGRSQLYCRCPVAKFGESRLSGLLVAPVVHGIADALHRGGESDFRWPRKAGEIIFVGEHPGVGVDRDSLCRYAVLALQPCPLVFSEIRAVVGLVVLVDADVSRTFEHRCREARDRRGARQLASNVRGVCQMQPGDGGLAVRTDS